MKSFKFLVVIGSLFWVAAVSAAVSATVYGIITIWPYLEAILIKAAA